jgi:4-hydroxy-2-oxoheptanedioate aldolase
VSLAHSVARFGATPLADYVHASAPPVLVIQLETADTDEPLDEILAAGADVAFIGVTDLTVDLGFDAARVAARVDELAAAARRTGVVLGGFGVDERFAYAIESSDLALLRSAYARG